MQSLRPEPLSISELTQQVKDLIEGNLPFALVHGEISNFVRASSGHLYLTLKDEAAQLRAVMWRGNASRLRFMPTDGLQVIAAGSVEVYATRGVYQLVIEELFPAGIGPLELAFRQLHEKLSAEGLFDPTRKRSIPTFPRRIALVTSPTGAAVRDMLQVMTRRWPGIDIVVVPVPVQGPDAASKIARALRTSHQLDRVDVVVTGRGGGSLEDLWAFNEEIVARAIFDCKLPVVSAVGHETDVTIADLVADRRALTPSEAAELVVPDGEQVRRLLQRLANRCQLGLRNSTHGLRMKLEHLSSRRCFAKPLETVHDRQRQLDELDSRLHRAMRGGLTAAHGRLRVVTKSFDALNPLAVLSRGYSITFRKGEVSPLKDTDKLVPGDRLQTRLAGGEIESEVRSLMPLKTTVRPEET